MKRLLREPLLHFVLLGVGLFAADAVLRERSVQAGGGDLVVTPGRIENLAGLFAKTWQRPPTFEELTGLVDDYVLEEALYREGLVLGVDRNDTIIRRRVRQKMEFVIDDVAELNEPSAAQLEDWLALHAATYAHAGRYSFRQVYLSPDRHGDTLQADARAVLAQLRAAGTKSDVRALGDSSLLEHAYADTSTEIVVRSFGQDFADGLRKLPLGEWSGPIESAFGLHLVLVDVHTASQPALLEEVRDEVVRDWRYAQREEAAERFYAEVVGRYNVSIEWPQPDSASDSRGAEAALPASGEQE